MWCTAAHVQARSCLDFLRVLRAILLSEQRAWDPLSTLDIVDERSLMRLLDRGGVRELSRTEKAPTVDEFLTVQRFLESRQVVQAVSRRLNSSSYRHEEPTSPNT
jgi:hypothetical protein